MKITINEEDKIYLEECLSNGEVLQEDLGRWFKEKWVDVSRKVDGKHPPCGRKDADGDKKRKGYPKCRPSKKVSKKTPKTTGSYSKKEKKSMTRQKRRKERKSKKSGKGRTPNFARFDENRIISLVFNNLDQQKSTQENNFSFDEFLNKIGDKPKCYLSGEPINLYETKSYSIDHIIPSSKGGGNELHNAGLTSSSINQMKSDMGVEEFLEKCIQVLEYNGYNVSKE